MILKEQVTETMKQMPSEFQVDDLIERLILLDKIDQGLDDIKNGRVFTHEEVKDKFNRKFGCGEGIFSYISDDFNAPLEQSI